MLRSATLGLLLLGVVYSWAAEIPQEEEDEKFCGMEQYEAGLTQTLGQVPEEWGPGVQYGTLHFDAKNQRMKMSVKKVDIRGFTITTESYFTKDLIYFYLPESKMCFKQKSSVPIDNCLPGKPTVVGKKTYGGVKTPLQADVVTYHQVIPGYSDVYTTMSVTSDKVPIAAVTIGKLAGATHLRSDEFYDVTEGIKDPKVFDLPAECKSASGSDDPEIMADFKTNPFVTA